MPATIAAVRPWFVLLSLLLGCPAPVEPVYVSRDPVVAAPPPLTGAPHVVGKLDDRMIDFQFEGGRLELELYRSGTRIEQVVRNRYIVPLTIHWTMSALSNLQPVSAIEGVSVLPPATAPMATGEPIVIAELQQVDPRARYRRELYFTAKFGDPGARPTAYTYALPYPRGKTFSVLQGFHGAFSHRGSNEFAVDFDCPVATPVVAARPGVVVAINASAQGSGTTPEFFEDARANFVLVLHDDGTIGEYMHLSPSGAEVRPGQRVVRGQELALSGNTGYSSTPHLHFQVMTAAEDGTAKHPFPFEFAVGPRQASAPVLGQRYRAWE